MRRWVRDELSSRLGPFRLDQQERHEARSVGGPVSPRRLPSHIGRPPFVRKHRQRLSERSIIGRRAVESCEAMMRADARGRRKRLQGIAPRSSGVRAGRPRDVLKCSRDPRPSSACVRRIRWRSLAKRGPNTLRALPLPKGRSSRGSERRIAYRVLAASSGYHSGKHPRMRREFPRIAAPATADQ